MPREIDLHSFGRIIVHENNSLPDDAGAVVWDAALVLAHYLIRQAADGRSLVAGKRVLELGAGTGVVGLVAAALGAQCVAISDLPHLIPHIEANIEANSLGSTAHAHALMWDDEQQLHDVLTWFQQRSKPPASSQHSHHQYDCSSQGNVQPAPASSIAAGIQTARVDNESLTACTVVQHAQHLFPEVVLGSDLVYQLEQVPSLMKLLARVLRGAVCQGASKCQQSESAPVVLLAYEDRDPITDSFFTAARAEGLVVNEVPASELHKDWTSPDIHIFALSLS